VINRDIDIPDAAPVTKAVPFNNAAIVKTKSFSLYPVKLEK
jgi:hypothetical protein